MIVSALVFIVSMNTVANCRKCPNAKSPQCCKQKAAKKAEAKSKIKKEKHEDEDIPLSQVPEKIKKIAKKTVKGIKLTEAELEDGVYELKGYVGDQKYEIKITPEGKVVKTEKDDDDDDENEAETDD
ncbi:MAG: hypothetical protein DRI44_08435 [Chlamydiae bacterium]|nr:MAG: hypothetical protein DRI44_08435 [Chlamydiota bacterium]